MLLHLIDSIDVLSSYAGDGYQVNCVHVVAASLGCINAAVHLTSDIV